VVFRSVRPRALNAVRIIVNDVGTEETYLVRLKIDKKPSTPLSKDDLEIEKIWMPNAAKDFDAQI
jgi:hypothetical protein